MLEPSRTAGAENAKGGAENRNAMGPPVAIRLVCCLKVQLLNPRSITSASDQII